MEYAFLVRHVLGEATAAEWDTVSSEHVARFAASKKRSEGAAQGPAAPDGVVGAAAMVFRRFWRTLLGKPADG